MGFFKKIADIIRGDRPADPGIKGTDGDQNAEANTSGMTSFSYDYIGSIGGDSHSYTVKMQDTGCLFSFEGMEYRNYKDLEMRIEPGIFERLCELCEKYDVAKWNGFNKADTDVLDGDGFSLRITFADGGRISAHGSNAYPKDYMGFVNEMREILDPFRDKVLERSRREIIDRGLTGSFEGGMFNFIQKGKAGSDSYFAMIYKPDVRNVNCEIRVKTEEYRSLPEGELRIYKTVPAEKLHLDEIDAIIKKYNLIEWYDYDKAAKDYMNAEWFQLSLSYGEDGINACGTEHPKGYEAFRRDFLKILNKIISEVKDL